MLRTTLAIALVNKLNIEVDSSIRRYRGRFCIDCVLLGIFDHSLHAGLSYQIDPLLPDCKSFVML
jgi:hypothetical protein